MAPLNAETLRPHLNAPAEFRRICTAGGARRVAQQESVAYHPRLRLSRGYAHHPGLRLSRGHAQVFVANAPCRMSVRHVSFTYRREDILACSHVGILACLHESPPASRTWSAALMRLARSVITHIGSILASLNGASHERIRPCQYSY